MTHFNMVAPRAPLRYFNDRGGEVRQRLVFSTKKNPNFRICLPKKILNFLAYPKKSLTSSKLRLSYCWFELMKSAIPKKIPVFFYVTQKILASFIDPPKSHLAKISGPKNPSDLPVSKIFELGSWDSGIRKPKEKIV